MLRQQIILRQRKEIIVVLFPLKLTVLQQEQNVLGKVRSAPKPSIRCTGFYGWNYITTFELIPHA